LVLPGIPVPDSFTSPNITDKAPLIMILEDFWAVFAFIVARTDFFGLDSAPLVLPSIFVPDSLTLPNITSKAPLISRPGSHSSLQRTSSGHQSAEEAYVRAWYVSWTGSHSSLQGLRLCLSVLRRCAGVGTRYA